MHGELLPGERHERQPSAGAHDSTALGEGVGPVGDVVQHRHPHHRVERARREGEDAGVAPDDRQALRPGDGEHVGAAVHHDGLEPVARTAAA